MKEYIEREAIMQAFAVYVWNSNHSDLVPAPQWNNAVDIVSDLPPPMWWRCGMGGGLAHTQTLSQIQWKM